MVIPLFVAAYFATPVKRSVDLKLRNYGLGLSGALAFALPVNAWPPWEISSPTPAVVWQALKTGATPINATSAKARRKDLLIRVSPYAHYMTTGR